MLHSLHSGHVGVIKIKAIARSYMWWPELDKGIEKVTKRCVDCAQSKSTLQR